MRLLAYHRALVCHFHSLAVIVDIQNIKTQEWPSVPYSSHISRFCNTKPKSRRPKTAHPSNSRRRPSVLFARFARRDNNLFEKSNRTSYSKPLGGVYIEKGHSYFTISLQHDGSWSFDFADTAFNAIAD